MELENLSEHELLAHVLGGKKASEQSLTLLRRFGVIRKLAQASLQDLLACGITKAQAQKIKVCAEVAKRMEQTIFLPGATLGSSREVFEHFHALLRDEKKEKFFSVLLDTKNRIIKKDLISVGTLNLCLVHPREVFATAIRECANSIMVVHNHPSGDPSPSQEDIHLTKRLAKVGSVVGIEVLDHVIIGHNSYISFRERCLFD